MRAIWQGAESPRKPAQLEALAREARRDLERLCYPAASWVPETRDQRGEPVLDVLIIGGGMCGQTLAFALRRDGITRFRILDANPRGLEGPWATTARMEILRSPKHLTGPDLGVPSLTFRAWYEAQHGKDGWAALHKAGRIDWRDYLLFVRDTAEIPVENEMKVTGIGPGHGFLVARLASGEEVTARRIVLAGGRSGSGGPRLPAWPGIVWSRPPETRHVRHSSELVSAKEMEAKRIAVVGAGASAFDAAATALEAGAREVVMLVRRRALPQTNKSKWTAFPGFLKGYAFLDAATRWQLYSYILGEQVPPPWESVERCDAHAAFSIRFSASVTDAHSCGDGATLLINGATDRFDLAIAATGFDVDPSLEPLLEPFESHIRQWRHVAPAGDPHRDGELGRFPHLGPSLELVALDAAAAPWLHRIHLFNWGITISQGALAGDIPGLSTGANRLAEALCARLLSEDIERHRAAVQSHDDHELKPTTRYVPPETR